MRDLALDRSLGLEVREDLLERVGIDAAAGHVLGAGEVAALHDQDGLTRGCGDIRRHAAGATGAHDDDVEISFFSHVASFRMYGSRLR